MIVKKDADISVDRLCFEQASFTLTFGPTILCPFERLFYCVLRGVAESNVHHKVKTGPAEYI